MVRMFWATSLTCPPLFTADRFLSVLKNCADKVNFLNLKLFLHVFPFSLRELLAPGCQCVLGEAEEVGEKEKNINGKA